MFRAASLLVLSLASIATANSGPPPWHSEQSWQAVFEFPTDDGVKWTVVGSRRVGHAQASWEPNRVNGERTITIRSPHDFHHAQSLPTGRAKIEGVSPRGERRTIDVELPSPYSHHVAARAVTFVRYRVEWGADGIELTLLKERHAYGPVVLAYILGAVSVVYAVGLWLLVRRRNRRERERAM